MSKKEVLEQIRIGNICSLCEKQLNWLYVDGILASNTPIALNAHRAICYECYLKLPKVR